MKKALIIDDSKTDRDYLESILKKAKFEVLLAEDGKKGVDQAKSGKPDIIFMDIVMDKMDGYEAARTLQNDPVAKSIPIIFVSSKKQRADRVWAKMQGGKELISKPYTEDHIFAQLKSYVN